MSLFDLQFGGPATPFNSLHFDVRISLGSELSLDSEPLVKAAFAECDGLEVTMDVKTIRSGGANGKQIRAPGPLSFGNVTLKRGMTSTSLQLWKWILSFGSDKGKPATVVIRSWSPGIELDLAVLQIGLDDMQYTVRLKGAVPVKLKAPPLNAREGTVAIEELQIAFEEMEIEFGDSLLDGLGSLFGGD